MNTEWICQTWSFSARHSQRRGATSCVETQKWTLTIFFNYQVAVTRKTRFRKPIFIIYFFLHCCVNSSSLDLTVHLSFILYESLDLGSVQLPLEFHSLYIILRYITILSIKYDHITVTMVARRDMLCVGSKLKANPILLSPYVSFFLSLSVGLPSLPVATLVYTHQERSFPYGYCSLVHPLLYSEAWQ